MNKRIITNKLICEFKLYLYEQERSKNTIEKYLRDVRCFAKNAGRTQLNKQAILEYKQYLCKKYSPRSVNSILSSMNTFFEFAGWHELKVKTLKIQRQIFSDRKSELTKSEYEQLLQAAKSRKEPLNHAASLDTPVNDTDDGVTLQDTLQDENTYIDFEQIELTDMQKIVREELAQLKDAKQQEFITDHYLHEQSYQAIATKYGISRERVRQIASAGLQKLRNSKRLRSLHGEFCNHIQTRFISFIEFNPQYFDLIRDIRERQKREYISYGKQQALIYQLTADMLKSGHATD